MNVRRESRNVTVLLVIDKKVSEKRMFPYVLANNPISVDSVRPGRLESGPETRKIGTLREGSRLSASCRNMIEPWRSSRFLHIKHMLSRLGHVFLLMVMAMLLFPHIRNP